jgi:hypothetical protein
MSSVVNVLVVVAMMLWQASHQSGLVLVATVAIAFSLASVAAITSSKFIFSPLLSVGVCLRRWAVR